MDFDSLKRLFFGISFMKKFGFLVGAVILLVGSAGCGPTVPEAELPQATATAFVASPSPEDLPTPTLAPTETKQPEHVILYAAPETDPGLSAEMQSLISELAASEGLLFEMRSSLSPADLSPETRLVVGLPPAAGLAELAAAVPGTQFLAVAVSGLQAGPNLSLVGPEGFRPDQQGFLAGYLAAVITPDWRAGVLATGGEGAERAARQGFLNGLTYFCGLCRPSYPPYQQYPLAADLSNGVQAALQSLTAGFVETIFLAPGVDPAGLVDELTQSGARLIGSGPPPVELQSRWVATVRADAGLAVRELWPQLMSGQGGLVLPLPIAVDAYDESILTPGRLGMVERFLQEDLLPGYINTGVNVQGSAETPTGSP